jgi:hypothetical protein
MSDQVHAVPEALCQHMPQDGDAMYAGPEED